MNAFEADTWFGSSTVDEFDRDLELDQAMQVFYADGLSDEARRGLRLVDFEDADGDLGRGTLPA
jgi:hypothetical protein